MTYVLLPSTGELADIFTDLVQHLDGAKVVSLTGGLGEQISQCTKFLEKHELRRDVIFVTRGTGGFVAQAVTAQQPERVAAILSIAYPDHLLKLPRFLFKDKTLVPTSVKVTKLPNEQALIDLLA